LHALIEADPAALTPSWQALLERVGVWVRAGRHADPLQAPRLRAELAQLAPQLAPGASWSAILRLNLVQRLDALIAACEESLALRAGIGAVMQGRAVGLRSAPAAHMTASVLHLDHGMALRSALAAVLAILVCCAFWIATGWPSGAAAPMMAGVFCCFFATQDDPVPAIKMFIKWTLLSMPVAVLYILCVLPAVHSFEMLVLAIAPFFLLAGAYMARAETVGQALAFVIGVAGTMSLQDTGTLDIPAFLNGMVAQLAGYIAAAAVTALVRTVSGDWMARRMLRGARREMAQLARAGTAPPPTQVNPMAARMVDRIGLLLPRLGQPSADSGPNALAALHELRVGLHIAQLRGAQAELARRGVVLRPLLQSLGSHFGGHDGEAPPAVLRELDTTLRAVCAAAGDAPALFDATATALASMRRDLFPGAAVFESIPMEKNP
jgi:uncharacterized membrane protein YccC